MLHTYYVVERGRPHQIEIQDTPPDQTLTFQLLLLLQTYPQTRTLGGLIELSGHCSWNIFKVQTVEYGNYALKYDEK